MERSFTDLLDRYRAGTLSTEDRDILAEQLRMPERLAELERIIDSEFRGDQIAGLSVSGQGGVVFQGLLREIGADYREIPAPRIRRLSMRQWMAAASVLVLIAAGWLFFRYYNKTVDAVTAQAPPAPILPAGNKAILILSNGNKIVLDSAANGLLAQQDLTKINKSGNGQLVYSPFADLGTTEGVAGKEAATVYNTLTTPRGGFYQLRLPDGTRVWLDAASSITYPVVFHGRERSVDLTGEAYFEVAQNKSMPFIVHTPRSAVTVLGTEFNVNAYVDEKDIRTTLISGAVKFSASPTEKLLHPGQQSVFDPLTRELTVQTVDVEQAIAWKNGLFEFDQTDLATIMRQIARWYDVDVSYQTGKYDHIRFGGGISRKLELSYVLRMLETNGVHFAIVAKKIIINP
jgi:transmembrane sensor